MKISDNESILAGQVGPVSPASAVGSAGSAAAQGQGNGATPAATVEISSQAQAVSAATAAVNAVPETRDDLVARIKAQVDAGTYNVSSSDIADQMLRRARADQIQ
jgi:negative regulator of flagellin synthesis FlgM